MPHITPMLLFWIAIAGISCLLACYFIFLSVCDRRTDTPRHYISEEDI